MVSVSGPPCKHRYDNNCTDFYLYLYYYFIHSYTAICITHFVENVESEALEDDVCLWCMF